MNLLYLTWQDPYSRRWFPVGRLSSRDNKFLFCYTKGATESNVFKPFGKMECLDKVYESSNLFPIFANRLMAKSRPEYKKFLDWLNLSEEEASPISILSITGGLRETDSLELFPCPEPRNDGVYEVKFFSRGISHLPVSNQDRIKKLIPEDELYILKDIQNPHDKKALVMRTIDPIFFAGYCPRYFNDDFNVLLDECDDADVKVTIEKVNNDAPTQMRLLCKLTACWPTEFRPCVTDLYEPLPDNLTNASCAC